MNETELVERCGKGDNLARKQLYERYAGQLMAVCVRYTGDREVAQDVLHDGFLNIFRSFSQFTYKGEGSLKAWLTRIMVNEALGYLRKKASTNQEVIVEELPDVIDGDEDDFGFAAVVGLGFAGAPVSGFASAFASLSKGPGLPSCLPGEPMPWPEPLHETSPWAKSGKGDGP